MFNSLDSCGDGTLDHTAAAAPVAASNALSRRISLAGQLNANMQHNRANGDTSTKIGVMTP